MVHDLRRSAVRNLMDAGVQQAVAMKISGHRDASVFQRYNVVDRSKPPMRCNEYNVSRPSRFAAHCLRVQPVAVGADEHWMVGVWWESFPESICKSLNYQVPEWRNWQTR